MAPPIEISIPSTSIASPADSKPFTQYNITLRLPLRSYVFQKRYNDFSELHTTLTKLVGAPPPAPLPAKHWFKNTVSSPELTEDRRRGLEAYLRTIAESPDRRWRDTPVWRTFLNLPGSGGGGPGSTASSSGVESRLPAINTRDHNLAAASDPRTWTDLHREMKGILSEARQQLAKRDATLESLGNSASNSTQALEAGASAKKALIRASNLIRALDDGLKTMAEQRKLAEGELRRRRDLVAAAKQERDGLEKVNASISGTAGHLYQHGVGNGNSRDGPVASSDKAMLLARTGTGGSSRRVLGAPLPETERTRELGNTEVLQLQRQQMAEQDQDVDELAKIIRRQKEMGLAIHQEVEEQNIMLDAMDENVTRVNAKVNIAKNKIRKLG